MRSKKPESQKKTSPRVRCGIDTGGTFTDLVGLDEASGELVIAKYPSSPRDPVKSIVGVIKESGLSAKEISLLVLGTTLGLNALLQRKGATVIYVTTRGFEDVLFIQRMNRRYHYSYDWVKPAPLVEKRNCLAVDERIDSRGRVLVPLTPAKLESLAQDIEERLRQYAGHDVVLALCLLFSYLNPQHEIALREFLRTRFPEVPLSASHEVAPIWREYERGSTTVADAYVKPMIRRYVASVRESLRSLGAQRPWTVMKSNGGQANAKSVESQPVNTLLSGLSGGVIGARYFADLAGEKNLVTLDMGGTSCDVGLMQNGTLAYVTNYEVEWGVPISAPFVDVTSIGAGGGSIGWVDKGGFLRVGPQSAGADPGPACYDQGGTEATVTDANLVLGRLNPDYFLGGKMKLNPSRATNAVTALGKKLGLNCTATAQAVIDVADENMANAIRLMSVERGLDPRDFALVSFGGAGPLHTEGIAEKMGMSRIVVPLYPGLCSAFGALIADFKVDKVLSQHFRSSEVRAESVERIFKKMLAATLADVRKEGFTGAPAIDRSISMRYSGQNYEHDVKMKKGPVTSESLLEAFEGFHRLHEQFYGYSISRETIELIRFNVSVIGPSPLPRLKPIARGSVPRPVHQRQVFFKGKGFVTCPVYNRAALPGGSKLKGPAILEEPDSTILLHPGNALEVNKHGVIVIKL